MNGAETSERPTEKLSVHVLCEQIFCSRAMQQAHEQRNEDRGREDAIIRLNYSPAYELHEIEEQLQGQLSTLWQFVCLAVGFATVGLIVGYFLHWMFFWAGMVAAFIPVRYFLLQLPQIYLLTRDHRAAQTAIPAEPNPKVPRDEPVNWWSLHAAGFTPLPVKLRLVDDDLGCQGRPWRILRRGDLAIPVFVRRNHGELRPQQRARIAAYCHLIRRNEQADSPYGIILDQGTFAGTAVKPTDADFRLILKAIDQVPRIFEAAERDGLEPAAPTDNRCKTCHHAHPRRYRPQVSETKRYGTPVPTFQLRAPRGGPIYHCSCGDRYGWLPEHERIKKMNLRPC
jgi:hypothetical protein